MLEKIYRLCLSMLAPGSPINLISRCRKPNAAPNGATASGGWIYIDAVVGTVIVAIALTAIILTYTQTTKVSTAATNRTQALYVAQQAIEYLKHNDGQTLSALNFTLPVSLRSVTINGISYTVTPQQIADNVDADTRVRPVRITVSWSDAAAGASSVDLISYYYFY